jgi:hypothetical protein
MVATEISIATPPLQVLLLQHPGDKDLAPVSDAIMRAFQGSMDPAGYLAAGAGVGITPENFHAVPDVSDVAKKLDAACHTLVIVLAGPALLDRDLQANAALHTWLADCWEHVDRSANRHRMLAFPVEESHAREFSQLPRLDSLQVWPLHKFDEYALRSTMVALLALHEARRLLALPLEGSSPSNGQPYGHLRFFISHAKIDALPLAQALRAQIQRIPWLRSFYDADDLLPGTNWKRELEQGVASSLIIVLRTDIYDTRYWCQQEITWADQYCTPAVLVDARTALNNESSTLPFTRLPMARVPDGNLMRILSIALREGVKFLLFKRRAEEMKRSGLLPRNVELRVFSYPPSMRALLHACRSLASANLPATAKQVILYPDPPLPEGEREAALALLATHAPAATLVTPQTLATSA